MLEEQRIIDELDYFNRTYKFVGCRETRYIKEFLYYLLEANSNEDLQKRYYEKSSKFDLTYKQLEQDFKEEKSLKELKFKTIAYSIDKLHIFSFGGEK